MGNPNDLHGRVSENKTNTTVQNHNARPCIIKEHDVSCSQNAYKKGQRLHLHSLTNNKSSGALPLQRAQPQGYSSVSPSQVFLFCPLFVFLCFSFRLFALFFRFCALSTTVFKLYT